MFYVINQSPTHIRSHWQNIQFTGFALGDSDFIRVPVEIGKFHVVDVGRPKSQFSDHDVCCIVAFANGAFAINAVEQLYRIISGPNCWEPSLGGHMHFWQPSGCVDLHVTIEEQELEIPCQLPYSIPTVCLTVSLHGNPIIGYDLASQCQDRSKTSNLEESVEHFKMMCCGEDGSFSQSL